MKFKDRADAGQQLANKLLSYKTDKPLILALPRGGVPVGFEIAKALKAPLDTLIARKIGAPSNPEFGVGAIAPGDVIMLDDISISSLAIQGKDLNLVIERERREMERRKSLYKSGQYSQNVPTDTIIIVDDGLATGVTARAAIESVLLIQKPMKLIFAAPICARDTADTLENLVKVVCVSKVNNLIAIGYWYHDFTQITDGEVIELLERASRIWA